MLRSDRNIAVIEIRRHVDVTGMDGWLVHIIQRDGQLLLVPSFYSKYNLPGLAEFVQKILEEYHGQSKSEELTEQRTDAILGAIRCQE